MQITENIKTTIALIVKLTMTIEVLVKLPIHHKKTSIKLTIKLAVDQKNTIQVLIKLTINHKSNH